MSARASLLLLLPLAVGAGAAYERLSGHTGTTLEFLAVGQGDATLLRHGGHVVLVDAGPRTPWFDAGERLVAPALRARGVRKIDLLVLTHPDIDHIGGLPALARRYRIGRIVTPAGFRTHSALLEVLHEAGVSPESVHWFSRPTLLSLDGALIRMWAPRGAGEGDNDGSVIFHLQVGNGTALLTGDSSQAVEEHAVRAGWARPAEVLKAGHHGSRTSTGESFLSLVDPSAVVISVGRSNLYNHPHRETLARIEKSGGSTFRTDRDGTITFRLAHDGFVPDAPHPSNKR